MTLLIYSTKTGAQENGFSRLLNYCSRRKNLSSTDQSTICPNDFGNRFSTRRIAILLASSREELQDILSIRELLEDTKIILIVPDTNPDTVAKGHTLRPRFLSDCNSDFVDVAAVLGQMIRKLGQNNDTDVHDKQAGS